MGSPTLMLLRGLGFALPTLVLVAMPAVAADPQPLLDQGQPLFSGGLSVRTGATQTLTAGALGLLVGVDLPLYLSIENSAVLLTVSTVRPPMHTTSATLIFPTTAPSADATWYRFSLTPPLPQVPGEVLRLTVRTIRGQAPLWGRNAGHGDPYAHGAGTWMGRSINDFAFRTYIVCATSTGGTATCEHS